MAKGQGAALDRKKLMADPIMVTTIVVLITFLTLFILYPLAILLVDSFVGDGTVGLSIFKGAAHPNAAKLWIEYALSPDCVELGAKNGSYQFLVIDNAQQPEAAAKFGLDPENVMKYDFEDATKNITTYIEEVMNAIAASGADTGADRFQTE